MKKNRIIGMIIVLMLVSGLLSACRKNEVQKENTYEVVCTVFPQYDWVKQIIGSSAENYRLHVLMDNGVDLHNYQPTVEDLALIGECDLFIYVGGESDEWVEDAIKQAGNEKMRTINLLEVLGNAARVEEDVEGMQTNEEEGEQEYDEHVWLSLKNAVVFLEEIKDCLCEMDEDSQEIYESNYNRYEEQLTALDAQYQTAVEQASVKTLLFGDRFPFRYLTEDYGLDYYAAFSGCSAETEASFETITFLAQKADEQNLKAVCMLESSDGKIAETIVDNTEKQNQSIVIMNSMQSVTQKEIADGVTYLGIMQENLEAIKKALN